MKNIFKTLLITSLLIPMQIDSKCCKKKCKSFCKVFIKDSLTVQGDVTIGGTLTVDGVDFNNLTGIAGAVGAAGPQGAQGIAGVIGAIGAAGAAGAPGTPGLPGIPGIGGILGWGYVYALTQAGTVAIEGTVLFDTNGPLSGVTHTPGSATVNVVDAGVYVVYFSVSGTESNQFGIGVNGVVNTSTIYGSGAGTQQNTGLTILTLGAGDALTLVNHSSAAAVTLAPNVGGTQNNVRASMLVLRIA